MSNYKLLISGVVPRFVGFVSTRAGDGESFFFPFSCVVMMEES